MELEISGFMADTKEYVRGNLEMGPEPAAQKFCEAVVPAVTDANPPSKRNSLGWAAERRSNILPHKEL